MYLENSVTERFRQNFLSTGDLWRLTFPSFKEFFTHQKWGSLSIFKFVTKSAKHQIASVSLTVQDRAISSKVLKHTVSKITTLPKNHFSYILALLSYKQNFLTWLSCHYFSFLGCFVFAMQKQSLCFASDPLVQFWFWYIFFAYRSAFAKETADLPISKEKQEVKRSTTKTGS